MAPINQACIYSTVRRFGFPIAVRTDYEQKMDRYAFLMVH
jgi:hypothetical protein